MWWWLGPLIAVALVVAGVLGVIGWLEVRGAEGHDMARSPGALVKRGALRVGRSVRG